jgi:anthranilate phosphoribosyltransferase
MVIRNYIERIQKGENLRPEEIEEVMQIIMSAEASQEDIADFLMALRKKGPTVDEITGAARIMRRFVLEVKTRHPVILDTCGTGGDKKDTFNISTLAALVVAGAGVVVAKHGNRSVSSRCGSADLLEALGVNLNVEQKHLNQCLDEVGIAFLFAQRLHPAMKNVAPVRKQLGVETIFNILGPLTNPAKATHQMMGVYNRDLTEPMAHVLKNLGLKKAMVVHGSDGMDEITTTGVSFVSEFNGRDIVSYEINPRELNIPVAEPDQLRAGDLKANLDIAIAVLEGQKGPHRDIVTLNAGCALYISEAAASISEGMAKAAESIDSGKALAKLHALKEFSRRDV